MKVTIKNRWKTDRSWGSSGPFRVVLETVEISDHCPQCGGPRGTPMKQSYAEDGYSYSVDTWRNPCGHADPYAAVLVEAGVHSLDEIDKGNPYSPYAGKTYGEAMLGIKPEPVHA
jgi:hypothetical protein